MQNFSLNKRLIYAVVASQILLAAGLAVVGISFSRHYIQSAFDVYIDGRAQSIAALVYFRDDGVPGLLFNAAKVPPSRHREHKDIFLVKSDRGGFQEHSANYHPQMFDTIPANAHFWNFQFQGVPYRAIVLRNVVILDTEEGEPLPLPKLDIVYAAPTMDIRQQLTMMAVAMALTSLLILGPTLLLALWNIRRALTPLHDLAATAGAISVDSWRFEPSQEARSTEELKPLIGAVQTVLARLEAAFNRQKEFLGDAAHELKTSLAILKSTLQGLLNKPRQPKEYERGLATMSEDCDRLERLLDRMLQTARAEQRIAKGREREPESVDVASTCEEAIARLAQFAAGREIRIDFVSGGEAMVRAETADLTLIWLNLLENAVQYSPRGSGVMVKLEAGAGTARVSVQDHGCGIDAVHLPHIFERFYRADSSRARTTGGVGLGLAIAKSLVDFYHGRIRVESETGRGTCVAVEFPLEYEASGEAGETRDPVCAEEP